MATAGALTSEKMSIVREKADFLLVKHLSSQFVDKMSDSFPTGVSLFSA